jgi:hypothetical protein
MKTLGELFAARLLDRRSQVGRRSPFDRRGDGEARVPFERRRGIDRRQLVGRRDGEHRPHITEAELKVLLNH